ncbi:MAG: murein hydrolase activator EnvC [Rhodospirillales bacterium]
MVRSRVFSSALLALALLASPAAGEEDAEKEAELKRLEAAVLATQERADRLAARQAALARESDTLSDQLATVAEEAEAWGREVEQVEATLGALVLEAEERRESLTQARGRLTALSGALLRISLLPPEVLVARPGAPGETVRAGLVMRRLVPRLEEQAARLRHEVADLESLEMQIEAENAEALAARRRLVEEEERLALLLQRRRELLTVTEGERQAAMEEAATLSAAAKDLRALVTTATRRVARGAPKVPPLPPKGRSVTLGEETVPGDPAQPTASVVAAVEELPEPPKLDEAVEVVLLRELRPMPEQPGGMAQPVPGEVVARFDFTRADRQGLRLSGQPGATVVAPYDGVVVYAGQFRSYGLVLILEHGTGYHSVLAELGLIDALLGQRVVTGEPVGALSEESENPPELYVELWRDGQTIDPAPWFGLAKR